MGAGEPPTSIAQSEQAKQQRKIANALNDIAASLKDAQKPSRTEMPCQTGELDRNSDLCAQWKAADAAADAAQSSRDQVSIGWIGLILGAITMGAAIAAAFYAKRAADVGKETIKLEYRPWLVIEARAVDKAHLDQNGFTIFFEVSIRNVGNGVARSVFDSFGHENICGCEKGWESLFYEGKISEAKSIKASGFLLLPGESRGYRTHFHFPSELLERGGMMDAMRPFMPAFIFSTVYRSTLSDDWHQTGKVLSFNAVNMTQHGFYDSADFDFLDWFEHRAT